MEDAHSARCTTGQLQSITNPQGLLQTLVYDTEDRLIRVDHSLGGSLTFTYDEAGMIATVTDPEDNLIRYDYATDGSALPITWPDQSSSIYHYRRQP